MSTVNTIIINIIGGPGSGKSVIASLLFAELKIRGENVEHVGEFAKTLVWLEDFDTLNNQHQVSTEQYRRFKAMNDKVRFIVTDGSLLHGLHYNKTNLDNTSDVLRTHRCILNYYRSFVNINIFLTRGDFSYEQAGRIQNEVEAKQIDFELHKILRDEKIKYVQFKSDRDQIPTMVEWILKCSKNEPDIYNVLSDKQYYTPDGRLMEPKCAIDPSQSDEMKKQ